jgi:hypothetical protein
LPDRRANLDVQFASDSFDLTVFDGRFVTLHAKPFKVVRWWIHQGGSIFSSTLRNESFTFPIRNSFQLPFVKEVIIFKNDITLIKMEMIDPFCKICHTFSNFNHSCQSLIGFNSTSFNASRMALLFHSLNSPYHNQGKSVYILPHYLTQ